MNRYSDCRKASRSVKSLKGVAQKNWMHMCSRYFLWLPCELEYHSVLLFFFLLFHFYPKLQNIRFIWSFETFWLIKFDFVPFLRFDSHFSLQQYFLIVFPRVINLFELGVLFITHGKFIKNGVSLGPFSLNFSL